MRKTLRPLRTLRLITQFHIKRKAMKYFYALISILILASCSSSSSFEADVRKMARLTCEVQQLSLRAMKQGENVTGKLEAKKKEAKDFGDKMKEKYKAQENNPEMNEQAQQIFEDEMKNCKVE